MVKSLKDRLIQALVDSKLIAQKDLERAMSIQVKDGGSLGRILVKEGMLSEKDLMFVMSNELSLPAINLSKYKVEKDCIKLIPEAMARQYKVIAICRFSNTLIVAMADPLDIFAIDDLKILTKFNVEPVLSTETDILDTIDKLYGSGGRSLSELIKNTEGPNLEVINIAKEEFDISEAVLEGETPSIVKVVNLIIQEALRKRASDIHVESEEDYLRVRYRIDGNLWDALKIPKKNQNAVLARLKIMSGMNITESRMPQDGRFKIRLQKKEVDFRVSMLPTAFGGKVVLRALDKSNLSMGLDTLGFSADTLARFKDAIAKPFGMILVTGPTGSGKSTTLYSVINQMNTPEKNIITIEDPVEYQVEGITQIQTNSDIGLTFANGLRSLLRQSPDIIMIGEIRDFETADIAIKASLTGQLVLSTLHTNDAPTAISRLMDMGIEPFLIASSVVLVAAQRLCRMICKSCKGKGCKKCSSTGYLGRIAILEALAVDDKIREMIIENTSVDDIRNYAVSRGMKTLRDDGMEKYKNGVTTMEEVVRVTTEE
ncbi:MAG: secretion system protein E [Candidatus Omnitrophica bacterium CG12_big_fil_rev_8_21_14_0_65_42_8]|nr:MAG: secretion system protein E [Candidatus Omnitrophica bacterium CG12_big_fil_rev_8_21_14_0_65_42_8]